MDDKKFKKLLTYVSDKVGDLLYYDRKGCEDINAKDCENITDEQKTCIS